MKASERMEHERRRKAFAKIKPLLDEGEVPILLIARPVPGEEKMRGVTTRCILGDYGVMPFDKHYAISALYQAFAEFVQPKPLTEVAPEDPADEEAMARILLSRARSFSVMGGKQLLIEDARSGPGNGHAGMQVMMLQGAIEGARLCVDYTVLAEYLRAMAAWLEGGAPEDRDDPLVKAVAEATRAAVASDYDFISRAAKAQQAFEAEPEGRA
ncbi:hypothetical protein [Hyphobacterium sp.]|uniref:hypothetical protein n=1 Tax=Hyphobacterium sp. TaxID=2004662 RepID=UPI003BAC4775